MLARLFSHQLIRFGVSGGITALLEFGLIVLLVEKVLLHYLWANAISFIVANLLNYLLSRVWVFQASDKKVHVELLSFFIVTGVGLLINQIIIYILVDFVTLDYRFAKIYAMAVAVAWNYFGKKKIVFKN